MCAISGHQSVCHRGQENRAPGFAVNRPRHGGHPFYLTVDLAWDKTYQPVGMLPQRRVLQCCEKAYLLCGPMRGRRSASTPGKASAQLFASRGYIETSVDDIAAAANVTKGGVYHYFASKTEILYFICSTYVDLDPKDLEQLSPH